LRDIISKLGNNADFGRLRIGIGHPGSPDKVSGYVLGKPPAAEQQMIDDAISEAIAILPDLLSGHANKAMNRLHSFKATA
jgi:PTH1 family peptidyl-tRNA hydrolase